jgi:hypothetical protein
MLNPKNRTTATDRKVDYFEHNLKFVRAWNFHVGICQLRYGCAMGGGTRFETTIKCRHCSQAGRLQWEEGRGGGRERPFRRARDRLQRL